MTMFRRKPGEPVEAVQFVRANVEKEPLASHPGLKLDVETDRHYIVTMHEQAAYLTSGDWILPESVPNRYYPVADSVFRKTYERVE